MTRPTTDFSQPRFSIFDIIRGSAECQDRRFEEMAQLITGGAIAGGTVDSKGDHRIEGINSRLDTLQAAILLPKLAVLDQELSVRQQVAETYNKLLARRQPRDSGVDIVTPHLEPHNTSAWAQYTVQVPNRETLQEQLKQAGIPTAVHYPKPLNHQPAYAMHCCPDCCPVSSRLAARVMSLPMSADLTEADQDQVVRALRAALLSSTMPASQEEKWVAWCPGACCLAAEQR